MESSNARTRTALIDGDEVDGLTSFRHTLRWRAGIRKRVKNQVNRRARREWRTLLEREDGP